MLVLTREVGERIYIGTGHDMIIMEVVRIRQNQVRLSFEGPRHVPIVRDDAVDTEPPEGIDDR